MITVVAIIKAGLDLVWFVSFWWLTYRWLSGVWPRVKDALRSNCQNGALFRGRFVQIATAYKDTTRERYRMDPPRKSEAPRLSASVRPSRRPVGCPRPSWPFGLLWSGLFCCCCCERHGGKSTRPDHHRGHFVSYRYRFTYRRLLWPLPRLFSLGL